jgi:hypothetical protein
LDLQLDVAYTTNEEDEEVPDKAQPADNYGEHVDMVE